MIWYITDSKLTEIANVIREKTGTTEPIKIEDLPEWIEACGGGIKYETGEITLNSTIITLGSVTPINGTISE